jgi:hypothetical protein
MIPIDARSPHSLIGALRICRVSHYSCYIYEEDNVTRIVMPSLQSLQQRLTALEAQIAGVKQEGDYLIGVRLERSAAGGTASQSAKQDLKYA